MRRRRCSGLADHARYPVAAALKGERSCRPVAPRYIPSADALRQLFGGLGSDRQRDHPVDSPLDRVELQSPSGRTWLQILRGRS